MTLETLHELFGRARPAVPGAVLAEVPGGPTLTYADAESQVATHVAGLASLGVRRGDRVAVQVSKSPDVLVLFLACTRVGAVFLPMNTAYTADEVAYLCDDAEPALFVHDPGRADLPPAPTAVTFDALVDAGRAAGAGVTAGSTSGSAPPGPDDVAAMLYTSGTTGRPKGAMLTQRNLASNIATLHATWGFGPGDVLLHALPLFHAHGLFVAAGCALANGSPMILLPRFDPDAVVEALPRSRVFMGVPTHYTRLLGHPGFTVDACRGVRLFTSGSAPLSAETHRAVSARTGQVVLERYGMTETLMLTSNPLDGERRPGTVGLPLPGVEVRVAPAPGAAAGARPDAEGDAVGGVEVRGPNVFAGYWNRPGLKEQESTADGWFRTGDLGRFDDDGYLTLVGRSKDLIISGGLNVYPSEVEAALDRLPGVAESAVVGVPDADFGEAVVAVVVAHEGADPGEVDPERLRLAARAHLAGFKVPKAVHLVDTLPRNTMGKVEKATLRRRLAPQRADVPADASPHPRS